MPLKFRFKAREEIPSEHQALYVERDGAFVLDVEGAVEKNRLDEFRSTNVALRREVESLNTRLADNSVESMVLQVASKFGVRAAALPDLTNRARQIFRMIDGELRPVQRDGKTPVLGADGVNAISFEEWVTRQVAEAPHLFESNAGGGATGRRCFTQWRTLTFGPELCILHFSYLQNSNCCGSAWLRLCVESATSVVERVK